jgi:hypothetical protein
MSESPSSTASNGRGSGGRFLPGNKLAQGNPFAKRVGELRQTLFDAVCADDLKAVVLKLVENAKNGDMASVKELLSRLLGPPESSDLIERLEQLEATIKELADNRERPWQT